MQYVIMALNYLCWSAFWGAGVQEDLKLPLICLVKYIKTNKRSAASIFCKCELSYITSDLHITSTCDLHYIISTCELYYTKSRQ